VTGAPTPEGGGPQPDQSGDSALASMGAFAAMGTTVAICVGLGVWLGLWLDRVWLGAPGGLLFGIALGTVAAVVSVVKLVRRFL